MKKKHLAYFALVLIICIGTFIACKKSSEAKNEQKSSLNLQAYIEKSKQQEQVKSNPSARYEGHYVINYESTAEHLVELEDGTYRYFLTDVYQDDELQSKIGSLVGCVLMDDQSVFNVLLMQDAPDIVDGTVHVSALGGDELGTYTVQGGRIIDRTIETEPGQGEHTEVQRSWFRCTLDCIGDAHYACREDRTCAVTLFISNLFYSSGSFSIAAACMGSCTKNRNLDLLPNH